MTTRSRKPTRGAKKRDLFAELDEGLRAIAEERRGKRTLRKLPVELDAAPEVKSRVTR